MIGARASLEFRSCYSFYVFVNVVVVVVFCSESLTEAHRVTANRLWEKLNNSVIISLTEFNLNRGTFKTHIHIILVCLLFQPQF